MSERDDGDSTDAAVRRAAVLKDHHPGYSLRLFVAQFLGLIGIVLYNWWVYVLVATNLLISTDEFFSDLEATGRPDATIFQHFDLAAGIIMLVAFLVRGPWGPNGKRKEWHWLLAFAAAGAVGGHYGYACPEGLSAACRSAEWHLRLPLHHYLHVISGIIEFATMTTAVYFAWKRTREDSQLGSDRREGHRDRDVDRLSAPRRGLHHRPIRRVRRTDLLRVLLGHGRHRTT